MTHNAHAPYLFENVLGSVLHCACCGRMQVVLGGLTLLMNRSHFGALQREVAAAVEALGEGAGDAVRLSVPTDFGDVAVRLPARKTRALGELLGGAAAMLDLGDRLRDTAKPAQHQPRPR